MARRTVYIPDELDQRIEGLGGLSDSYSQIVQEALRDWADEQEESEASSTNV